VIFIDSSFLIAAFIKRDKNHAAAHALYQRVAGRRIVTTNHVRGETWTWMRSRSRHDIAVAFLDNVESSGSHTEVVRVSEALESEALRWLRQHDEREYSFVDATSFAYMRAKGIEEALAFDGDFAAAGFAELRP
jgi:predicted nucleic acid-binding protein